MNSPPPRLLPALEFLLYAVLTAIMLHATWLTWPDAFIDFSRELYLPWRVSCGDVLYRDLAYYFGPVSVYTNAALFALLGRPSIHALFALNFAFWVSTLLALRALLRRIASPLAATLAVSSCILLFSFSRYLFVGNYNFLAPYSHEITRGFLFALLALLSLDSALRRPSSTPFRFLLPVFLYALVLFSKPELALATSVALALLFALHAWKHRTIPLRPLLAFALVAGISVAFVIAPFAMAMHSIPAAMHDSFLKLYLDCFNPELTSLPFFKGILGTDNLLPNVCRLGLGAFLAALPFLLARFVFSRLSGRFSRMFSSVFLFSLAVAVGWFAWNYLNAAISLAPPLFFAAILLHWRRSGKGTVPQSGFSPFSLSTANPSLALGAAFSLFALALALKFFFNASIMHYGFVLGLPAFCCAILLLFRPPCSLHGATISVFLLFSFLAGGLQRNAATIRNHAICTPVFDDSFRTAGFQAKAFNDTLSWLRNNTPPGSTLAVLPEGAFLNVFANRPNPTPYVSLPITDIPRYDAEALLSSYSNTPPDTLVLVTKLGEPRFGIDYAQDLMGFLNPLYTPVFTIPLSTPAGTIPYLVIARKTDSLSPPDYQEFPPP